MTPTPVPSPRDASGVPVEFGYKAQVTDNADGIVLDHRVEVGNPPDVSHARSRHRPHQRPAGPFAQSVTADHGYGEAKVEAELQALGVQRIAIPRKGRPGAQRQAVESTRRFRKLVKWRTGSEGRISYLKHSWGWERTMLDGIDGTRSWCGWGVLAHNATKIAVLINEREQSIRLPLLRPSNERGPPTDHRDARRRCRTLCPPDLALPLSCRAFASGNGRKRGQKRLETSEQDPMAPTEITPDS